MNEFNINSIKFDDKGLVVAIATDVFTNEVLMQAYMNKEALELTLKTHEAHYFSRSRNELWHKGKTSGNIQKVISIVSDCDNDCILMRVVQSGGACHTGARSCFFNNYNEFNYVPNINIIQREIEAIQNRKTHPKEGSYTNYLLNCGKEKICKKVGEESAECIISAMNEDNEGLAGEIADLLYHIMVLMECQGLAFKEVLSVMEQRRNNTRPRNY